MSFKENLDKFRKALAETPQSEILRNKLWIQVGQFIGISIAIIYILLYTSLTYWLFFLAFAWAAVGYEIFSIYSQYKLVKMNEAAMAEMIKQQEAIMKAVQAPLIQNDKEKQDNIPMRT